MRSRLIVNPVSGANTGPDHLPELNQLLRQAFGELDIVMTVGRGDAAAAAESAARDGYERIFIAGGDGTLNEVLNGVAAANALDRVAFGVLPLGTGNDFAAALGIPADLPEALDVLRKGISIAVDLGQLDQRVFANVSAGGFIAEVSEATGPGLKTVAGKLAYLLAGAQVVLEYEPVHASVRALLENGRELRHHLDLYLFAVCNSRLIGGGRLIAPDAVIDDGLLDVCLVEAMPTLEFIGLLTRVADGDHLRDPRVRYFRASAVDFSFSRPIHVNSDGEVLCASACRYSLRPRAARFLAGAAPYAAGDSV